MRPVYILSLRQRAELAALAGEGGRPVVATRRGDDAARRFAASGAAVAIVDLRSGWDAGLETVAALAEPVAARAAALLVLASRGDLARLGAARAAGATHFLASPFVEEEFRQALAFAEDGADRRGAGRAGDSSAAARTAALARDLPRALAGGEIEVAYQPQLAAATGAVTGVEALMRWRHPEYGALGAEALLDAAERAALIPALTDRVHRCALAAAAAWPAALGALRLSLNVTAEDLATADFAAAVAARIAAAGFPPARVTLEVTERALIADPPRAAATLNELRALGCATAIDDFGTGYSSLAYLSQLPLDVLKLDRALTQDIAGSPRDRTVVRGIIELAHSLGLAVIAEGVETERQRDLLTRAGVATWQGYLFAEPLDAAALVARLA